MHWVLFSTLFLGVIGQLYVRVEPFMVNVRVMQFLEDNNIDNCFERLVDSNELHLKCLRDSALVDVHVSVIEELYV